MLSKGDGGSPLPCFRVYDIHGTCNALQARCVSSSTRLV
jgi:hypothetical protein